MVKTVESDKWFTQYEDLSRIVGASSSIIYRCEPAGDYPATYISENITRIMGYSPEDFTRQGSFWADCIHPDDKDRVFNELVALFEHDYHSHEYRFKHADGSYRWMMDELRLVRDQNGEPIDIIGNWIDVTRLKSREEETRQFKQQLHQIEKMQAVGTLAGGIAHEFNNMLGVIVGYGELAAQKVDTDSPLQNYIQNILIAAERSGLLVNKLLSFSQQRSTVRNGLNVLAELTDAMSTLKSSIPDGVEVKLPQQQEYPLIWGNSSEFRAILANVCTNAVNAMHGRGSLKFEIVCDQQDSKSESATLTENMLCLSIIDDGDGMEDYVRARALEPFFTTGSVGDGTGMGLALVYSMMKAMGGEVEIQSAPGQGCRVNLYFEKCPEESVVPEPVIKHVSANQPYRVLLVDDEALYLDMVEALLLVQGHKVTAVRDPLQALALAKQRGDDFDLMITDQLMPGMTGSELARQVLSIKPDFPIILCTGFSAKTGAQEAEEIGIAAYAMKPVNAGQLEELVQQVMNNSR